jgi:hypothetical protein
MFPYGSGFGITGQKGYYSTIGGGGKCLNL